MMCTWPHVCCGKLQQKTAAQSALQQHTREVIVMVDIRQHASSVMCLHEGELTSFCAELLPPVAC